MKVTSISPQDDWFAEPERRPEGPPASFRGRSAGSRGSRAPRGQTGSKNLPAYLGQPMLPPTNCKVGEVFEGIHGIQFILNDKNQWQICRPNECRDRAQCQPELKIPAGSRSLSMSGLGGSAQRGRQGSSRGRGGRSGARRTSAVGAAENIGAAAAAAEAAAAAAVTAASVITATYVPTNSVDQKQCMRDFTVLRNIYNDRGAIVNILCKGRGNESTSGDDSKGDPASKLNQCKFVVKIVESVDPNGSLNYKGLYECEAEKTANASLRCDDNFCVKMHNSWFCNNKIYLVFTRYDDSLYNALKMTTSIDETSGKPVQSIVLTQNILGEIVRIIRHTNSKGWIHSDCHLRNFLVNYRDTPGNPSKDFHFSINKIVQSDFGRAGDFKHNVPYMYLLKRRDLFDKDIAFLLKNYDIIYMYWFFYSIYSYDLLFKDPPDALEATPFPYRSILKYVTLQDIVTFTREYAITDNDLSELVKYLVKTSFS